MITKVDFVRKFAADYGYSIKKSAKFIDDLLEHIIRCSVEYGGIKLVGFGNFEVLEYGAKKGQNMHTGETIDLPKHNYMKFKPSKQFKEAVK